MPKRKYGERLRLVQQEGSDRPVWGKPPIGRFSETGMIVDGWGGNSSGSLVMNTALVIVDVENDFCLGGPVPVPDADAVIPIVNDLMRGFRHVFLTQDWHPRGHISFASSHAGHLPFSRMTLASGEQLLWPDHCVENTPGAKFHRALDIPVGSTVIRKGSRRDMDSYSAFLENDRMTPVGLGCDARGG